MQTLRPEPDFRIFVSANPTDRSTALDLQKYLKQALPDKFLSFWNPEAFGSEDYRRNAAAFLEKADLFIAALSADYQDLPDTRWEMEQALQIENRHGRLQILCARARAAHAPLPLRGFPTMPPYPETIEAYGLSRERQLERTAELARELLLFPKKKARPKPAKAYFKPEDVRERLLAFLGRHNLVEAINFLELLIHPDHINERIYELEDRYAALRQYVAGAKIDFESYLEDLDVIRGELAEIILAIEERMFVPAWPTLFEREYLGLTPLGRDRVDLFQSLFKPADEIIPPDYATPAPDDVARALSAEQRRDFVRKLLLCRDALAVNAYAKAFALCEEVRTGIDPQSAQLYEYMLIAYVQKEGPDRIANDWVSHSGRLLEHAALYASRFGEYQRKGCGISRTGIYNCQAVTEELADAFMRLYSAIPDNYTLDTGYYDTRPPANRAAIKKCIEVAPLLFRLFSSYQSFLKVAVNELCGGGKLHWVRSVYFDAGGKMRFVAETDIEVESQVKELIEQLRVEERRNIAETKRYTPWKPQSIEAELRENLLLRLLARRDELYERYQYEQERRRNLTDWRQSVIRFVNACMLGHKLFGHVLHTDDALSFRRLALEQLLPDLLLSPDTRHTLPVRWFDLNEDGQPVAHPDCRAYQFDPMTLVEKIIKDRSGVDAWLVAEQNLHRVVWLQYCDDTLRRYRRVMDQRSYQDWRRMPEEEARRELIGCIARWARQYYAYPDEGRGFLNDIIREIVGDGALQWLTISGGALSAVNQSIAMDFDALAILRQILRFAGIEPDDPDVRSRIAHNIFEKSLKADFQKIPAAQEKYRAPLEAILSGALECYRIHPDPRYLDFVYEELTLERKLPWTTIHPDRGMVNLSRSDKAPFRTLEILRSITRLMPDRFPAFETRERIAERRYNELLKYYEREVSPFKSKNGRPERAAAIAVILRLMALYKYMPKTEYLQIPIRELSHQGRVVWHDVMAGFFPLSDNHPDNYRFAFDYRSQLAEARRLEAENVRLFNELLVRLREEEGRAREE